MKTILITLTLLVSTHAFITAPFTHSYTRRQSSSSLAERHEKLKQLGFSENELRSKKEEPPTVRVDLVEDVDPITLTAIGFALIAANFLIFANMGDGGLAGLVATVINMSRQ